jgi:hypothetical protein
MHLLTEIFMSKFNRHIKWLMTLALLCIPALGSAADEMHYSLGLGLEFASGTYGTGARTNSVFIPFTAAVYPSERLDLFVEIPVIYQSNNNVISSLGSGMHGGQTTMGSSVASTAASSGMMGGSSGMGSGGMGQGGLGDITVKAGYILVPEKELMPQIRPNVFIKFPTADKNRSLGTGEYGGGFALEFLKWLDSWCTYAEAGYAIQGNSSAVAVKNYLYYTIGAGYQVTGKFRPMFILKGSTAPVEGVDPLLEARLKLKYQATQHTGIEGYLAKGITASSPDYGTGLAVFYDF